MAEFDTYSWAGSFCDLKHDDRLSVAQLVVAGGAVIGTVGQIAERLNNSRRLVLLRQKANDRLVGVASLKSPNSDYRLKKFADAHVAIAGYEGALELGYVTVAKDMRGQRLSSRLVELVVKDIHEPTFATTDSDTMKNNLSRSGFKRVGREWQGRRGALSLWILTPSALRAPPLSALSYFSF
jgi:predicted GNAT family N-acyltransferase